MGLSPRPTDEGSLYGWDNLDYSLQHNMKKTVKEPNPSLTIDPKQFSMSTSEIVEAGKQAGYNVAIVQGISGELIRFT
ncbi:hypothetical protein [Loigolactobacillus bifermentans]|nr:hypothetical protein [Loigolactobacillus bifermentans]QGG59106.1 hypothetical protein LB003_00760 [Loigolactobacillus bifermentans]